MAWSVMLDWSCYWLITAQVNIVTCVILCACNVHTLQFMMAWLQDFCQ